MNRKGFTLVEFLGCLAILGLILCIGLYTTKGTLSTTLSTLTDVSENQIYEAAELYIIENKTTWINDTEEYTCLMVNDLVDAGYFDKYEVTNYQDSIIKIVRNSKTRVVDSIKIVDVCK